MASTSSFLPPFSPKTPVVIDIIGSIVSLGSHWRDFLSNYANPLVKRLEENYPRPLTRIEPVVYSEVLPALIDPVYSVGHDEDGADSVIKGGSPGIAAFRGYMAVIKIIDDFQMRYPNEEFSFFLWHVVVGQHGSWDPNWEIVRHELKNRNVNLSMVFLNDCPIFVTLFSEISPASSRIKPWFPTFPGYEFLLSGFMPLDELGGAVPSLVSIPHTAPSISVPSNMEVTWDSPLEFLAHETPYPDDPWTAPPFFQHPDNYSRVPAWPITPFLDSYECPQAPAVPSQPHFNLSVPEAHGLAPMDGPALPHSSGVEQKQPTPHNYTERIDSRDDFTIAIANARLMSFGLSDEMSDNECTAMLNLNGTRVPVRALLAEAAGDPKLSALPTEWDVELAVGPKLSTLAIQVWIRKNNAPMVRLIYLDGSDNSDFDRVVEEIRAHGYAIVTWENRDRLLLAPLGKILLCAVFPEKGTPKRPTSQSPRKVRTVKRKPKETSKEGNSEKKENSKKTEEKKLRQGHQPYPATTSKCSNGSRDGRYPKAAAESTIALQQLQPELPQMLHNLQVVVDSGQGEIDPSSQWHQNDAFAQHQIISPPQFPVEAVEQHVYLRAPWRVLGVHGEQLVHQRMGTVAAGYMADPSNLNSEAMDDSEMYEDMDFDGYGD